MRTGRTAAERGEINWVTTLLILGVIGAVAAAALIAPKSIANYSLKHEMDRLLLNAKKMTDTEMVQKLNDVAEREGIPLPLDKLECHRSYDTIFCQYEYTWPVTIGGNELFKMKFDERVSKPLAEVLEKI